MDGATGIARRFYIPELLIGATILLQMGEGNKHVAFAHKSFGPIKQSAGNIDRDN